MVTVRIFGIMTMMVIQDMILVSAHAQAQTQTIKSACVVVVDIVVIVGSIVIVVNLVGIAGVGSA